MKEKLENQWLTLEWVKVEKEEDGELLLTVDWDWDLREAEKSSRERWRENESLLHSLVLLCFIYY